MLTVQLGYSQIALTIERGDTMAVVPVDMLTNALLVADSLDECKARSGFFTKEIAARDTALIRQVGIINGLKLANLQADSIIINNESIQKLDQAEIKRLQKSNSRLKLAAVAAFLLGLVF